MLVLPVKFAIQFQLLGGIWIIQIFPAVVLGLYLTWMRREALIAGWLAGTGLGTWMAASSGFSSAVFSLYLFGYEFNGYASLYSVAVNIVVVFIVSGVLALFDYSRNRDVTCPDDYEHGDAIRNT